MNVLIILLVFFLQHLSLWIQVPAVITSIYGVLLVTALFFRLGPVLHLLLFIFLWRTLHFVLPEALTNTSAVYFAIVFLLSVPFVRFFPLTKDLLSWWKKGRVDGSSLLALLLISAVSAAALIAWGLWSDSLSEVENMLQVLKNIPSLVVLFLVLPVFALLNAFSEEMAFRGIFQEAALRSKIPLAGVILFQGSCFAAVHFEAGFPNGFVGYMMTLIYGSALGVLRHWTQGLLIPYLTHICADLVIFYFLYFRFLI